MMSLVLDIVPANTGTGLWQFGMNHEGGSVVRGLWSLKQTLFKEMSLGLGRNVTCIMSQ